MYEILEDMKRDEIITDPNQCLFYRDEYSTIFEWEFNLLIPFGENIKVIQFYEKDNVHYRDILFMKLGN